MSSRRMVRERNDEDTQEEKYGDDPWFIESSEAVGQIGAEWEQMEQSLRDTARLFNSAATSVLEKFFLPVIDDRTHEGHQVVTKVGQDHPIATLFRAREFESLRELESALSHPESGLGTPPVGIGAAGRMNCAGIPVFYGATRASTAIAEVRSAVGAHVAVAMFKIIRELTLLDLRKFGDILLSGASKFNPGTVERAIRNNFLRTLTERLTMPVLPSMADTDYLITQAIADFLATHSRPLLDGIIFPSTQDAEREAIGCNIVLFRKASTVLRASREYCSTGIAYLFEYEDNSAWFSPIIESGSILESDFPPNSWPSDVGRFEPALELDRSVWVHKVEAVRYSTKETPVRHVRND